MEQKMWPVDLLQKMLYIQTHEQPPYYIPTCNELRGDKKI